MSRPLALATAPYEVELHRLRVPAAGVVGGGLVLAHLPASVGVPCPLRALTGVPCPFCGLTTSVRQLLGGRLHAAVAAAPLGLVVVAVALAALLGVAPAALRVPRWLLVLVLGAEWAFELVRFHVL